MKGNNSIIFLFIFLLIYLINYIQTENFINESRSIINLKIKGNNFQKIMGSRPFPDLIYLNGKFTLIDYLGRIFIKSENEKEISNVTLIWNQTIDNCEDLFKSSINIIEIDLSNFDASIVTSMTNMFENCEKL